MNDALKLILLFFLVIILIFCSSIVLGIMYGIPSGNVAVITIDSEIVSMTDYLSGGQTSDSIIESLINAENNPNVEAIVLSINSGGGMSVASKEIANQVLNSSKPVIAWIRELGASGAYMIASASDYVICDNLSIIGSIGASMSYLEFSGTLAKYGAEYNQLVSGDMKDMGSMYRNMTSEEQEIFMTLINDSFNYFLSFVVQHRNLTNNAINVISDGRIVSGKQGFELGLVDELGSKQEVNDYLRNALNITAVTYEDYTNTNLLSEFSSLISYKFSSVFPTYN
ncbi:signal peptide peptidase SppA [archaeon CG07_land_8_20_14_0_80_38_8]|nr:MAG: signal peptide peptidase SppA [archaeon CG07_land_8_20_14_0_80_38_8]